MRGGGHSWDLRIYTELPFITRLPSGLYCPWGESYGPTCQAALKTPAGIVCLVSALWVHGLVPAEPLEVDLAIGAHAHRPRWRVPPVRFFRMRRAHLDADVETRDIDSIPCPVFTLPRTIVDCLRFRQKISDAWGPKALRDALERDLVTRGQLESTAQRVRGVGLLRAALARYEEGGGCSLAASVCRNPRK